MKRTWRRSRKGPRESGGTYDEVQVFTRMPPPRLADPEAVGPPHIGEHELLLDESSIALVTKRGHFLRTGNPVLAIEAFILAHMAGLYPPAWVVHFLADRLAQWHEKQALGVRQAPRLDEILGLRRGKRRPAAIKQLLVEERNEMLMLDVKRLVELGASVDDACALVAERLKNAKSWDKSRWNLGTIGADRLKRLYNKSTFKNAGWRLTEKWTSAKTADFLGLFPSYHLPENLKRLTRNS